MKSKNSKNSRKVKKVKKSPSKKRTLILKAKKRRGKEVYDIMLPSGSKTENEIDSIIDKASLNLSGDNEFVKLTFVTRFKKQAASISYIETYDFESKKDLREQIRQSLKDINYTIFRKPTKNTGDSIKRMNRLKNFLNRIIIDFESSD